MKERQLMNDRELWHYGIKGQRWGIRRYTNPDGTLTPAGKARYREDGTKLNLRNMTDEEYDYAMQRMQKERAFNDMRRSTNSSGISSDVAKKLVVAAIAGASTIALTEALSDSGITDSKALARKILLAVGTTTISGIASSYGVTPATAPVYTSQPKNVNIGNNISADTNRNIQGKVGAPKGMQPGDDKAYQDLFRTNPTEDQRAMIKAMRKSGYSVDQIKEYVF